MIVKYFKTANGYAKAEREEKRQVIHTDPETNDVTITYEDADIAWPDGREITEQEYTDAVTKLAQDLEDSLVAERKVQEDLLESAVTKLAKLGLTPDEVKALVR